MHAASGRPSVSRVRENRKHGLKGGAGTGLNLPAPVSTNVAYSWERSGSGAL